MAPRWARRHRGRRRADENHRSWCSSIDRGVLQRSPFPRGQGHHRPKPPPEGAPPRAKRRYAEGTATDYDVLAAVAADNAKPEVIHSDGHPYHSRPASFAFSPSSRERSKPSVSSRPLDPTSATGTTPLATAFTHAARACFSSKTKSVIARDLVKIYRRRQQAAAGPHRQVPDGASTISVTWKRTGSSGASGSISHFRRDADEGQGCSARSDVGRSTTTERLSAIRLPRGEGPPSTRSSRRARSRPPSQTRRLRAVAEAGYELGAKTFLEVEDALLNLMMAQATAASRRGGVEKGPGDPRPVGLSHPDPSSSA